MANHITIQKEVDELLAKGATEPSYWWYWLELKCICGSKAYWWFMTHTQS